MTSRSWIASSFRNRTARMSTMKLGGSSMSIYFLLYLASSISEWDSTRLCLRLLLLWPSTLERQTDQESHRHFEIEQKHGSDWAKTILACCTMVGPPMVGEGRQGVIHCMSRFSHSQTWQTHQRWGMHTSYCLLKYLNVSHSLGTQVAELWQGHMSHLETNLRLSWGFQTKLRSGSM